MSDKMRSEFEKVHCGNNKHVIRRNEHGFYVLPSIQDAWGGFQSAWQAARTVPEGFVLVSEELIDKFPEINPSNYDHDDACELNAWGVELVLSVAPEGKK